MTELKQCQCDSPGWCKILKRDCDPEKGRKMGEARFNECKHKPHYFEMFLGESQTPCGARPPKKTRKRGLGDIIESVLSFIGITPKRIEKITGKPCGCKKRKEKLNQLF